MLAAIERNMEDAPFSVILKQFLNQVHREDEFQEHAAKNVLLELIPENQRILVKKVWCDKGRLFVKTDNASFRFELLNQRSSLVNLVNQKVGKEVVREICLV